MTSAGQARSPDAEDAAGIRSVSFCDPDGQRWSWAALTGPTELTGDGLPTRVLTTVHGVSIVQHYLPEKEARSGSVLVGRLENEVRIGLRLVRRYPLGYPAELGRLIGYDLDAAVPFVLHAMPRGRPCSLSAGRLALEPLGGFERSLVLALSLLAAAGVVHGELDPETIKWDGRSVHIDGFGGAARIGERREVLRDGAWSSPEQREGPGGADPADDMWSAGLVILHVATGRAVHGSLGPPDLENRGVALRGLLAGVFAEDIRVRPSAQALADRLGGVPPVPAMPVALVEAGQALERGRRAYETALSDKQSDSVAVRVPPPASGAGRQRWWLVATPVVVVLAIILVIGVLL